MDDEIKKIIHHDLTIYNQIFHKAYKGVQLNESLQKMIKTEFGPTDYFPLSAIYEAKVLLKANACSQQYLIKKVGKRIDQIALKLNKKRK